MIEAFICGTKVMELLSYLRLKFKNDFIRKGVPYCMHREYLLKCEGQKLCYDILRRLEGRAI